MWLSGKKFFNLNNVFETECLGIDSSILYYLRVDVM